MCKKRSLKVGKTNFDTLNTEYIAARSRAREWELNVYGKFSKTDQLSITGILAYLEDIERGIGRDDNEKVYVKTTYVVNCSRNLSVGLNCLKSTSHLHHRYSPERVQMRVV